MKYYVEMYCYKCTMGKQIMVRLQALKCMEKSGENKIN